MDNEFNNLLIEFTKNLKDEQINLSNNLNNIFNKLDLIPVNDDQIKNFINIYNTPLIYLNIGIDIINYLIFREILEYKNISYGKKIVEYSIKYKRSQEFKNNLIEHYKLIENKFNLNFYDNLEIVYNKIKNKYEKDILENYYHFYDFRSAPIIKRKRSKTF